VTLRLTLRAAPDQRVDLSALTPDRLAGLAPSAIERIPIQTTRTKLHLAELFRLRHGTPETIAIEGGNDRLDRVGQGMTSGLVVLDGDAGVYLGHGIAGGRIDLRGDAGAYAASGATGGQIEIGGDAGDFLGGALPGAPAGMAGGLVIVRGAAGARPADRLRRGLIVIEGDCGDAPASRMIAGTLIVCGTAGPRPGMLMRRGTLVLSAAAPLPSFVPNGTPAPVFLRLLARALQPWDGRIGSRRAARLVASVARAYAGDMAALGKGELLLPARAG
jgi:formylmethanofuran dehydrogenase subunit C